MHQEQEGWAASLKLPEIMSEGFASSEPAQAKETKALWHVICTSAMANVDVAHGYPEHFC